MSNKSAADFSCLRIQSAEQRDDLAACPFSSSKLMYYKP